MRLLRVRSRRLNRLRSVSYAPGFHGLNDPPRTNSISLCFFTVRTRGSWSSSSSSATNIVSSTSPRTRLQCESYAYSCLLTAVLRQTAPRKHTCSLPFNSRSPRNLTMTISSMHRRTRSSGSLVSSLSSIVGCVLRIELQSDDHHEVQLWQLRSCLARGPSSRGIPS